MTGIFYFLKIFLNLSLGKNSCEACPDADVGDLVVAMADLILEARIVPS